MRPVGIRATDVERKRTIGIVIVDHGSRLAEANDAFLALVRGFATVSRHAIVEPAHMEIAPPTIDEAFARAIERGATEIVVHPFFLLPGRHWTHDIPELCRAAALRHGGVNWRVTRPLGESRRLLEAIAESIDETVER
jgi:sirohydrochlorin ferrochelatase